MFLIAGQPVVVLDLSHKQKFSMGATPIPATVV